MELMFFDRNTLTYKDHGYVDSDFEINLDLVIIKKSTFVVNKININTGVGDIVIVRDHDYFYIGLVDTIEVSGTAQTIINTLDFKEIFNFEVPVTSFTGSMALYLENLIMTHLIASSDPRQNLSYLTISKETTIEGTLTFEADKLMKIQDVIELISKTYGVSIRTEVLFLRGRISGIRVRIVEVTKGIKLKSNLSAISDLVISDSDSQVINKVIYYPKQDNKNYKSTVTYFLLTNGDITDDCNNVARYNTVNVKSVTYSDSDYPTLESKARSEMLTSRYDHNITFTLKSDNFIIHPLDNLNLGDFIEFITPNKTYDSVVTGIRYKNTFNIVSVTLGEYRMKLTEKIQLLNRSVTSAVGNISIQTGVTKEIDGGEF
jgi:hypothetical protein